MGLRFSLCCLSRCALRAQLPREPIALIPAADLPMIRPGRCPLRMGLHICLRPAKNCGFGFGLLALFLSDSNGQMIHQLRGDTVAMSSDASQSGRRMEASYEGWMLETSRQYQ
jgi:hypothetical protein